MTSSRSRGVTLEKVLIQAHYVEDHSVSPQTIEFLGGWLSGGGGIVTEIPENVALEVAPLNHRFKTKVDQVYLYRGIDEIDKAAGISNVDGKSFIKFEFLSSWTYDEQMARNFNEEAVVKSLITKEHVFLDSTVLDKDFIVHQCGGFPEEKEVLVYPGSYQIEFL